MPQEDITVIAKRACSTKDIPMIETCRMKMVLRSRTRDVRACRMKDKRVPFSRTRDVGACRMKDITMIAKRACCIKDITMIKTRCNKMVPRSRTMDVRACRMKDITMMETCHVRASRAAGVLPEGHHDDRDVPHAQPRDGRQGVPQEGHHDDGGVPHEGRPVPPPCCQKVIPMIETCRMKRVPCRHTRDVKACCMKDITMIEACRMKGGPCGRTKTSRRAA